jgi:flagellar hook protein FlgE
MASFSIPLSGLTADAQDLSVISNNLANLNTTGYKDQAVSFRDLYYQQLSTNGSGNGIQVGSGTAIDAVESNFTGGTITSTGVPTDAAISGNGFFVTQDGGAMQFTRDGNFAVSSTGELTTQDGAAVMGYQATNGIIGSQLTAIQIGDGMTSPAVATTSLQLDANLSSAANVGDSYSTPLTVYDSMGTAHMLDFQFTKTATNTWGYQVTVPAADTGAATDTVVASGSMSFDGNGNLISPTSAVTGSISGLADGASPMTFSWNLVDANGNPTVTQLSAASGTTSTSQNGYTSGTLTDYNINSTGVIEGSFSNGQTMALGQIALANFSNEQGLQAVGDNSFQQTLSSGAPAIGTAGSSGLGTLQGGSLESSNVDMATEFSNLITAQRDYQASAKVVTTLDDITQDLLNMKNT